MEDHMNVQNIRKMFFPEFKNDLGLVSGHNQET